MKFIHVQILFWGHCMTGLHKWREWDYKGAEKKTCHALVSTACYKTPPLCSYKIYKGNLHYLGLLAWPCNNHTVLALFKVFEVWYVRGHWLKWLIANSWGKAAYLSPWIKCIGVNNGLEIHTQAAPKNDLFTNTQIILRLRKCFGTRHPWHEVSDSRNPYRSVKTCPKKPANNLLRSSTKHYPGKWAHFQVKERNYKDWLRRKGERLLLCNRLVCSFINSGPLGCCQSLCFPLQTGD